MACMRQNHHTQGDRWEIIQDSLNSLCRNVTLMRVQYNTYHVSQSNKWWRAWDRITTHRVTGGSRQSPAWLQGAVREEGWRAATHYTPPTRRGAVHGHKQCSQIYNTSAKIYRVGFTKFFFSADFWTLNVPVNSEDSFTRWEIIQDSVNALCRNVKNNPHAFIAGEVGDRIITFFIFNKETSIDEARNKLNLPFGHFSQKLEQG